MPSKSRRPSREEVRISILHTARDIAATEGWQCVTVRKVAERIGYTAPIIYEHFGSKDVMLTEILKIGNQQLYIALKEAIIACEDPGERLLAMANAYWNFAHESTELYQLMHGMAGAHVPGRETESFGGPVIELVGDELIRFSPGRVNKQNMVTHVAEMWSVCHGVISLDLSGYIAPLTDARKVLDVTVRDMLHAFRSLPE